jgi:hypothetical protein
VHLKLRVQAKAAGIIFDHQVRDLTSAAKNFVRVATIVSNRHYGREKKSQSAALKRVPTCWLPERIFHVGAGFSLVLSKLAGICQALC